MNVALRENLGDIYIPDDLTAQASLQEIEKYKFVL